MVLQCKAKFHHYKHKHLSLYQLRELNIMHSLLSFRNFSLIPIVLEEVLDLSFDRLLMMMI